MIKINCIKICIQFVSESIGRIGSLEDNVETFRCFLISQHRHLLLFIWQPQPRHWQTNLCLRPRAESDLFIQISRSILIDVCVYLISLFVVLADCPFRPTIPDWNRRLARGAFNEMHFDCTF